jgi:hypothetical protein
MDLQPGAVRGLIAFFLIPVVAEIVSSFLLGPVQAIRTVQRCGQKVRAEVSSDLRSLRVGKGAKNRIYLSQPPGPGTTLRFLNLHRGTMKMKSGQVLYQDRVYCARVSCDFPSLLEFSLWRVGRQTTFTIPYGEWHPCRVAQHSTFESRVAGFLPNGFRNKLVLARFDGPRVERMDGTTLPTTGWHVQGIASFQGLTLIHLSKQAGFNTIMAHTELHGLLPLSKLCPGIDDILGPEPTNLGYHFQQARVLGVTNLELKDRWQLVVCYHFQHNQLLTIEFQPKQ